MGFWYFLVLSIGVFLVAMPLLKRSITTLKKSIMLLVGICMLAFSLFMFQDGSAEIVNHFLTSLNINL